MWHTVLITLHALSGTIALAAGCVALLRCRSYAIYLWSLVVSTASLVAAIAEEWSALQGGTRGLFLALAALGVVMVWLAATARRARYFDKIGFTLVALVDAFVVVTVLNVGAPAWAVVAAGVLVGVAGHFVLRAIKPTLPASTARGLASSAAGTAS